MISNFRTGSVLGFNKGVHIGIIFKRHFWFLSYFCPPYLPEEAPPRLLNFLSLKWGAYSSKALISGRRLFKNWNVPIELSRFVKNFLQANAENKLLAQVTGPSKREVGLFVSAKFTVVTTELRIALCIARILNRGLNGQAVKYNHFELKNIAFDEKKFPMLFPRLCSVF